MASRASPSGHALDSTAMEISPDPAAKEEDDLAAASGSAHTESPCGACLHPAHTFCARCKLVAYCSRDCQKAHWKQHKVDCRVPIVQLPPGGDDRPSIITSKTQDDLLACAFSFLSHNQSSLVACVNHAWRNASLLLAAASSEPFKVSADVPSRLWRMSPTTRAHLASLEWNALEAAPPPPLRHLRRLLLAVGFENPLEARAWSRWMAHSVASLQELRSLGTLFDRPQVARVVGAMKNLRVLDIGGPDPVAASLVAAVRELTSLEYFHLYANGLTTLPGAAMSADESQVQLLLALSTLPSLREALLSFTMLTPLLQPGRDARLVDLFPHLKALHIALDRPAAQSKVLIPAELFAQVGRCFPALAEWTLSGSPGSMSQSKQVAWRSLFLRSIAEGLAPLGRTMRVFSLTIRDLFHVEKGPSVWASHPLNKAEVEPIAQTCPLLEICVLSRPCATGEAVLSPDAALVLAQRLKHLRAAFWLHSAAPDAIAAATQLEHLHHVQIAAQQAGSTIVLPPAAMPPAHAQPAAARWNFLQVRQARFDFDSLAFLLRVPPIVRLLWTGCGAVFFHTVFALAQFHPLLWTMGSRHTVTIHSVPAEHVAGLSEVHALTLGEMMPQHGFIHEEWKTAMHIAATNEAREIAARFQHLQLQDVRFTVVTPAMPHGVPVMPPFRAGELMIIGCFRDRFFCAPPEQAQRAIQRSKEVLVNAQLLGDAYLNAARAAARMRC